MAKIIDSRKELAVPGAENDLFPLAVDLVQELQVHDLEAKRTANNDICQPVQESRDLGEHILKHMAVEIITCIVYNSI
jgi:hypothetical protein